MMFDDAVHSGSNEEYGKQDSNQVVQGWLRPFALAGATFLLVCGGVALGQGTRPVPGVESWPSRVQKQTAKEHWRQLVNLGDSISKPCQKQFGTQHVNFFVTLFEMMADAKETCSKKPAGEAMTPEELKKHNRMCMKKYVDVARHASSYGQNCAKKGLKSCKATETIKGQETIASICLPEECLGDVEEIAKLPKSKDFIKSLCAGKDEFDICSDHVKKMMEKTLNEELPGVAPEGKNACMEAGSDCSTEVTCEK